MIHVSLFSELPLITFFYLSLYFSVFFFGTRLRELSLYLPSPPLLWQSLNACYGRVLEIFWNEVLLRDMETVNNHAIDIIG